MPRQARLDAPGTLHHVIIRGIEQRQIVDDDEDRKNFVDRMGSLALETDTAIYAWALLTNHAHILLRSGPPGLSKYMKRFLTGRGRASPIPIRYQKFHQVVLLRNLKTTIYQNS